MGTHHREALTAHPVGREGYLLTDFQIHQATTANRTQGTSALKTRSTSRTTRAETAVRLVSAFASSVM